MIPRPDVSEILKELCDKGILPNTSQIAERMNGTTDGAAFTFSVNGEPKYVLKLDEAQNISLVEQFYHSYASSPLLPKLLYTSPDKTFIVYTFIAGVTHVKRGAKIEWLTQLVYEVINRYKQIPLIDKWGYWLEEPCQTWREFIERGVDYARDNVGNLLPLADYHDVRSLAGNIPNGEASGRFLLHGDCGVHNFVFDRNVLSGIIDPSPIAGPPLYDFLYAFCSSPDDLTMETLIPAFSLLNNAVIERTRLIEEVIVQLYCRIGICLKYHRHDLSEYMKAWDYWKTLYESYS